MPIVEFTVGDKPVRFISRVVENRHGSAVAAVNHWLAGSLWGNPIKMTSSCIHVYGIWKRDWSRIYIYFGDKQIWLIKPLPF